MHFYTYSSFLLRNTLGLCFLCSTAFLLTSCEKTMEPVPLNIAAANFEAAAHTIQKNSTDPYMINIPLTLPMEEEGTLIISIGENGTALSNQYTTSPELSEGKVMLSLSKDAIEASFALTSANNFADDVSLEFVITSASGGVQVGKETISTLVTMKGNDPTTPEISTSVSSIEDFGLVDYATESESKSFTISSRNLTENIVVEASEYFEVSLDDVSFSKTLEVGFDDTNLLEKEIFVRFIPTSGLNRSLTGAITVISPQVTERLSVLVSGQESGNITSTFFLNEDFSYGATGGDLRDVSGNNWTLQNASTTRPVLYVPNGLSLPGFPSEGGAVTMNNGSNCNVMRTFENQSSGTIYTSIMLNISAASTSDIFFFAHFLGGTYYNRLYATDNGGNLQLGIARAGTSVSYSPQMLSYNTTYLVIIKYNFSTEESSIYILDGSTPALVEPATADAVSETSTAPASIESVIIRQSSGIFTATLDEMRVSTSWRGAIGY